MEPDVQSIIDALPDPAIVLSRDYRIVFANAAYVERYGMERTATPQRCYEVSHGNTVPCDQAGEHCPLRECLETGATARVLHVHHTPQGEEYVNVETWPVRDGTGDIAYFVEVLRPSDIERSRTGLRLIGRSPAFQQVLGLVDRVAPTQANVLLLGESGTGKEVIARTIHDRSERSSGPFVPVECTGLPESLFESELFGHEKGAFTGAEQARAGLVESADGGTLFLDEIGEIPPGDQVRLLRLLETRQFRRVGSTRPRTADFRLVCATNRNLPAMVAQGSFREDLYYRLSVFVIALPPLRKRIADLPQLAAALLEDFAPGLTLSKAAIAILQAYSFPGNIRELRNILEYASIMCDGTVILPRHLPLQQDPGLSKKAQTLSQTAADASGDAPVGATTGSPTDGAPLRPLADVEADYLRHAVATHTGDRRSLAARLGISERALYRKLSALTKD